MTVLIASSKEDPASTNIKKGLLKKSNWEEIAVMFNNPVFRNTEFKDIIIVTINDRTIRHENLDKQVEKKLDLKLKQAIYISRHDSKTGEPTLTTHPIGNYSEAQFGGKRKTLTKSAPKLMTQLLRNLKKNAESTKLIHQICFEVTHHGPYLSIPTLFIEVGSKEEEWRKKNPANTVAQSILDLFELYHYEEDFPSDIPVLIGIGGGHYAPRFTDIIFEKKAAFGHMIPAYQINSNNINIEMLNEAIKKTPNINAAYIHRKSLRKSQISQIKKWIKQKDIPVISSKELENIN
jgi:D-aminoacyl-tRNA deacylase